MVALLTSDPIYRLPHAPSARGASNARRSRPRHLHAVSTPGVVSPGTDAGLDLSAVSFADVEADAIERHGRLAVPATELLAFALVVVVSVLLVASFRSVQGPPAISDWKSVVPTAETAPVSADELIIAVQPGDTLWGIAGAIAPDLDRREVVQRLADRNGGSAIWAGQDLIVPASVANL